MRTSYILRIFIPLLLTAFFLYGCAQLDMKLARSRAQEIMKLLFDNDWSSVWDESSMRYKKIVDKDRMLKLEDWVESELGKGATFHFSLQASSTMLEPAKE